MNLCRYEKDTKSYSKKKALKENIDTFNKNKIVEKFNKERCLGVRK